VDAAPGNGACASAGGNCTLRAAIQEANALAGADTIVVPVGNYVLNRGSGDDNATNGDLDITTTITILGAGARSTVVDGNALDRVFDVRGSGVATISGVTITNGDSGGSDGGGIRNEGTLTLTDVSVDGNTGKHGGGVANNSTMTLVRVTLLGNSANSGDGGGIQSAGASPRNYLTNVTISGNSATGNGGGAEFDHGELVNVTISDNTSPNNALNKKGGQSFTLKNTIIAGNAASSQCAGTITSLGYNIDGDASCDLTAAGDLPNTDPLLGALQDNGGPTDTHELPPGSPAIDAGTDTGAPSTDQRGTPRPLDGDGDAIAVTDIGAFEIELWSIGGRVFEDADFAGTASDWDGGVSDLGLGNADVELYDAGTDTYLVSVTSGAGGTFTFTGLENGDYKVRARSATIGDADTPPAGGLNATVPATWPYPLAEMTWAQDAAAYGGQSGTVDDTVTADNAGPGDTYVAVSVSGADVADVNLGFAYNLIVNADDDSNADSVRSKQGGLRQFLKNANAIGATGGTTANLSQFRMQVAANQSSGADSWWRITTPVALPSIADGGTELDGVTQTTNGGNTNTLGPEIEIVGNGTINGINIVSAGNTVRGLTASGYDGNADFAGVAINGGGATGNTVAGNHLGTNATGTAAAATPNYQGVAINGASGNTIGGLVAADRNVLSGNRWNGVRIKFAGATGNTVAGNYIGTNAAGTGAVPNELGVYVWDVPANVIGGTSASAANVLSGNAQVGVYVFGASATGNLIQGNTIGLDALGAALPNGTHGVQFASSPGNTLGGSAAGAGNTIASNTLAGVSVAGAAATDNAILSNSIYANGGLGIDLSPSGVTPNDAGDSDTGPNDLLNFPLLTAAVAGGGTVTASFDLDVPAGTYRVEFFRNPSGVDATGHGEGETFAGTVNVTHLGGGTASFSHTFAGSTGDMLTATATLCADGAPCTTFGSTSEFDSVMTAQPISIVKRAFQLDGTPIPNASTVPRGVPFRFLFYVNNPGGAIPDVSLQDPLDAAFAYQAGTILFDASIPACAASACDAAEEAAIYAAVIGGSAGSDAVDGDVVSFTGAGVHAGNEDVANEQLDLPAGKVWALVFTVKWQ
jgi:hypothetical protein